MSNRVLARSSASPVVRRAAAVGIASGLALGFGVGTAQAVPGGKLPQRLKAGPVQNLQAGAACVPSSSRAARGLTPKARNVLNCVDSSFPGGFTYLGVGTRAANPRSDHGSGRAVDVMVPRWNTAAGKAQGWQVANYVTANAKRWGVTYVIWDAKIYNTSTGKWKAYRHPSGARDANNMHLNHVHVSVGR